MSFIDFVLAWNVMRSQGQILYLWVMKNNMEPYKPWDKYTAICYPWKSVMPQA